MAIWLNEEDVRAVLPLSELIECMEGALAAFSAGQVRQPVRTGIEAGVPGAVFAPYTSLGPAFHERFTVDMRYSREFRAFPSSIYLSCNAFKIQGSGAKRQ